jgi:CLIP-associating protein 1/2
MGEKITEAQATDLLTLLRTDASVDTKVAQIDNVKSGIKKNNVPDICVGSLFEITRIAMTSQHAALVNAGFSTLNHLLTRLSRQEPKHVTKEVGRTLPLVVEKLGDHKEKYRLLATQCLTTFWKASSMDVERAVRNSAMTGKNSRAKETSMHWIVQVFSNNLSSLSIMQSLTCHYFRCIRRTTCNSEVLYQC